MILILVGLLLNVGYAEDSWYTTSTKQCRYHQNLKEGIWKQIQVVEGSEISMHDPMISKLYTLKIN